MSDSELRKAIGFGNVMEGLWRAAEDEIAKLQTGLWPSDHDIAEAFHEHRREHEPSLPPWSEVQKESGIGKYTYNFVDRIRSLPVSVAPPVLDKTT